MKKAKKKGRSSLIGVAGEHFVLCELLRRGYIAALAPSGVPNIDIVVTNIDGSRLCSIQVKSRSYGVDQGWHMKKKHEEKLGERFFYCFVDFEIDETQSPIVYVVPCDIVAQVLSKSHQQWLATPGHKGQARKDGDMRRLRPDYSTLWKENNPYPSGWLSLYKNAWDILKLDVET